MRCTHTVYKLRAFTLIEMSIVLMIIGLIVGGILVGQNLIASAQLRAQVSQFEKYNQAVNAFRSKYDCLPGDCLNATKFLTLVSPWGNGNGNGVFDDVYNQSVPYSAWQEPNQFWVHLFAANMTDCCLGVAGQTQASAFVIGQQFPQAKLGSSGIGVLTINSQNGYFWGILNNTGGTGWVDSCGGQAATYCNLNFYTVGGAMTPPQALAFDSKIDDGQATTGNVYAAWLGGGGNYVNPQTYLAGVTTCLTASNGYNTSYTANACSLFIKIQGGM